MKYEWDKKYAIVSVYVVLVVIVSAVAIFLLAGARDFFVNKQYTGIFKILTPFIYGVAFAYLLNPILLFFERKIFRNAGRYKDENKNKKLRHTLSIISTYIITAILITLLCFMIIPQVGESVNQLASMVADLFSPYEDESEREPSSGKIYELEEPEDIYNDIPTFIDENNHIIIDPNSLVNSKIGVYANDFASAAQEYIDNLGIDVDIEETFNDLFFGVTANIIDLVAKYIAPVFNATASILLSTASWIFNVLLAIIISIYVLSGKDTLIAQIKKLLFAIFPESFANRTIKVTRKTHEVFGGFITGKFLDSFIIGVICFICMTIFDIRYSMLISVIVGVTNMIPFFGPFIGAIPSIFFLMINDFWQAVWFAVFILILQQVDGNIIGPKILGSTIGLSSFWVIFAIIVMNGLFGIFGMFVGLPIFAVIYILLKEFSENKLKDKGLPVNTDEYILAQSVTPEPELNNKTATIEAKGAEKSSAKFPAKIENFVKKIVKNMHKSKDNSDNP